MIQKSPESKIWKKIFSPKMSFFSKTKIFRLKAGLEHKSTKNQY